MGESRALAGAAAVSEIAGASVVLSYGDVAAEYRALHEGVAVIDRGFRGRMRFSGAKAAEVLTGLVSNDVQSLQPGAGQYAAALTPKGKIVADVRIFVDPAQSGPELLLVDTGPRAWPGWLAMVRKFVNPRLAKWADVSRDLRSFGLFGPRARHVVSTLTGGAASEAGIGTLPMYGSVHAEVGGVALLVARVPDLGMDGYDVFLPEAHFDRFWDEAVSAGGVPAGLDACEIARVEAGRPEWGIDMDENTLAPEANLDDLNAVSYTKGCYVGQEVVARVHFRGHVNRLLRGVRAVGDDQTPLAGARLVDEGDRDVGDVRSAVVSPRIGSIAIAMIRREIEAGTELRVRSGAAADAPATAAARRAVVTALPFSP